jgi:DNA-binding transcriptional ArsR family regulator
VNKQAKPRTRAKTKKRTLPDEALVMVAERFKVLSEPMRLRILHTLQSGAHSVNELVDATGAGQANVSKHLAILADAAMVSRRKEGLKSFYFISDPKIFELCELMCSKLEKEFAKKSEHFR